MSDLRRSEAVVDAARLEQFALWGISGAPAVAIAYAVRHPERVSHLDDSCTLNVGAHARVACKCAHQGAFFDAR
jgi:pimeloyl-ACP methyl ester carboxylesterase